MKCEKIKQKKNEKINQISIIFLLVILKNCNLHNTFSFCSRVKLNEKERKYKKTNLVSSNEKDMS